MSLDALSDSLTQVRKLQARQSDDHIVHVISIPFYALIAEAGHLGKKYMYSSSRWTSVVVVTCMGNLGFWAARIRISILGSGQHWHSKNANLNLRFWAARIAGRSHSVLRRGTVRLGLCLLVFVATQAGPWFFHRVPRGRPSAKTTTVYMRSMRDIRAGPRHTFCKGPRLREINHAQNAQNRTRSMRERGAFFIAAVPNLSEYPPEHRTPLCRHCDW